MQDGKGEAVVIYREPLTTQQMRYHRLSRRVNNMAGFSHFIDVTGGEFHKIAQKNRKARLLLLFRTFCHVVYATLGYTPRLKNICGKPGVSSTDRVRGITRFGSVQ